MGYVRKEDASCGRWFLRRNLGGEKQVIIPLGLADDEKGVAADGTAILTFEQARAAALDKLSQGSETVAKGNLTVRKAFALYVEYLQAQGKDTKQIEQRAAALILPELGDRLVVELTSRDIRKWLAKLATKAALARTGKGKKQNTKPQGEDEEAVRKRRNSANRVLAMVKGALNYAFDEGLVDSNTAWGRRVKPFKGVSAARVVYLKTIEDAQKLINAANGLNEHPGFGNLVRAALETGARYSELARVRPEDFNPDSGTLTIRKSKTYKARHIILTADGTAFFTETVAEHTAAGRRSTDVLFRNDGRIIRKLDQIEQRDARLKSKGKPVPKVKYIDKGEWRTAEQTRPMALANKIAEIESVNFHALRHTWASHAVMNGVPLIIVAKNLGHKDTRMVEEHYGHLAPTYVREAILKGAPKFGSAQIDKEAA